VAIQIDNLIIGWIAQSFTTFRFTMTTSCNKSFLVIPDPIGNLANQHLDSHFHGNEKVILDEL